MQKIGKMLTKNGKQLHPIAMGTWNMGFTWTNQDRDEALASLRYAFEKGINALDTAPIYGKGESERFLASFIANLNRDDLFIATKCGLVWDDKGVISKYITPDSIKKEIEASLKRMQIDYIDLYQFHWPANMDQFEASLKTLQALKEEGLIRYIGLSNFSLADFKRANQIVQVDAYQGIYNLIERDAKVYLENSLDYRSGSEIIPYCHQTGATFLAYSPLLQGLLGGKFKGELKVSDDREQNININNKELLAKNLAVVERLKEFALTKNCTVGQLSLAYILHLDVNKLLLGGLRKASYVEDALGAMVVKLSSDEMSKLAQIATIS